MIPYPKSKYDNNTVNTQWRILSFKGVQYPQFRINNFGQIDYAPGFSPPPIIRWYINSSDTHPSGRGSLIYKLPVESQIVKMSQWKAMCESFYGSLSHDRKTRTVGWYLPQKPSDYLPENMYIKNFKKTSLPLEEKQKITRNIIFQAEENRKRKKDS